LKFSTKTRYGIRALLEIALHTEGAGVFQKDIAENQKLSIKYLDHIISALKIAGLISNVKGKKSGYILTRAPKDISMLDVHNAFEAGVCVIDCLSANVACEMENCCATKDFWLGMNDVIEDYLVGISLADIVSKHKALNDTKR
jgi:Rrf2 family protein